MKKILSLLSVIFMTFGCYDDSDIRALLNDHESRLSKLETLCSQMNTNITALQTAVSALEKNVYVTAVIPVKDGGEVVGYAIAFNNSESITIYHGKDGADGVIPVIGVRQDADGVYYWTLNGEWLFDSAGNKVKASGTDGKDGAAGDKGSDGVTPKLKIKDGYWYVSYDGQNWDQVGKATGDSSNLVSVTHDAENVYLTLRDGVVITLPKGATSENPQNSAVDLSVSGIANCYIVSEAGLYKFRTVKGNSSVSAGSVSSAAVLWESFGTSTAPAVGELVKSVVYSNGYVAFQTADTFKEGNAVIAAKDSDGNILWSWHIWFTDQPQGQVYYNDAGTMMDRNLGATSATPGDVGALGLLYQWGRKDPFLGSSSISDLTLVESTITWPSTVSSDSSNGTIEYATAHPTTFITYNSSNYDWYYTGSSSTDNTRWTTSSSAKSIYDPCPAGWRVPDGGSNGVWSKALGSSSYFTDSSLYNGTNKGMNFSGKFGNDQVIWYPASGYRGYNDGSFYDVGYYGYYWSASPSSYYAYGLDFYYDGYVYPSSNYYRAFGQSVRCLQESK